jgi:hypothetical protein
MPITIWGFAVRGYKKRTPSVWARGCVCCLSSGLLAGRQGRWGNGGLPPSRPVADLGADLIQFAPQHFRDQAPLVPHSDAQNSHGEGECREKLKRLCLLFLSEPR